MGVLEVAVLFSYIGKHKVGLEKGGRMWFKLFSSLPELD